MRNSTLALSLLVFVTACSGVEGGFKSDPVTFSRNSTVGGNPVGIPGTPGTPPTGGGSSGGNPTEAMNLQATVVNSPADVASWPVTTNITQVRFTTDGIGVNFSKKDGPGRWPDITPPGWQGPLEYTLWIVISINGHWYTSGVIQYWNGLDAGGGDVTQANQVARNWFYDSRWGALVGHQPYPGDKVGFFVTSGNARGVFDASQSIRERSNVVLVSFPSSAGPVFNF